MNKKKQYSSGSKGEGRYSNIGNDTSNFKKSANLSGVQMTEKQDGYHFELKIVGYIKDDFNCYINNNDLVLTTAKRSESSSNSLIDNKGSKHSYCYASAFFKKTFHLPHDIAKDEIFVDYNNHILSIDLLKSNTK
jgi:HSP20 family molecular chaperone IbpA